MLSPGRYERKEEEESVSMDNYHDETYGERIADVYDEWYPDVDEAMLDTLADLADGGRALELGIGTGRVALPLQARGIEVHGIDASEAMIARLHTKPGGEKIHVTVGNFADIAVEGQYSLIYVVFSTFFALLTQEEQSRCFENVARRLSPKGAFVIEAYVPDFGRFEQGQTVRAIKVGVDEVRLEVSKFDPVNQQVTGQKIVLTGQGVRLNPIQVRFAWPSELDLMARLAGLRLWQRWESWQHTPFSEESKRHISLYRMEG
jgi:SAM-dependent methyltransferase